jgi:Xaa-Pro aminopeptidase
MTNEKMLTREIHARMKRVRRSMRLLHKNSALIVSSGVTKQRSRDLSFPFHQDENFFYLTGSHLPDTSLLIFSDERAPLLITPQISAEKLLWDGQGEDPKRVARRVGAHLLTSPSTLKELRTHIEARIGWLFYPNERGQDGYTIAQELLASPSHRRRTEPVTLSHIDTVLEPLRLRKSPYEVRQTQQAVDIAWKSLQGIRHLLTPGITEEHIALALRHAIESQHSSESFPSIVASGPNAAVLHHTPSTRKLKSGEYLTVDFGAIAGGYASDVTRVFAIGEKNPPSPHREAYHLLRETQRHIVSRVRPGKVWRELQSETEELLLKGLRDIGLLKGSLPKLRKERAVREFFPHSLGHALGLAVHDVGALRSTGDAVLAPGMVVTVEPGIYSRRGTKRVPPFGMRIEDDVLVTNSGAKNLTHMIPIEP